MENKLKYNIKRQQCISCNVIKTLRHFLNYSANGPRYSVCKECCKKNDELLERLERLKNEEEELRNEYLEKKDKYPGELNKDSQKVEFALIGGQKLVVSLDFL